MAISLNVKELHHLINSEIEEKLSDVYESIICTPFLNIVFILTYGHRKIFSIRPDLQNSSRNFKIMQIRSLYSSCTFLI